MKNKKEKINITIGQILDCVGNRSQFLDFIRHCRKCEKCQKWLKENQPKK